MALSEFKEGGDPLLPYRMRRLSKFSIAELDAQMYAHSSLSINWSTCDLGRSDFTNFQQPSDRALRTPTGIAGEK